MAWFHTFVPVVLATVIAGSYGQNGLTAAQKKQFVDVHNNLRSNVDPPATNMKTMKWNDELATIAQNYANKCIFDHNPSRKSKKFSYVGENLYLTTGTVSNYGSVVQSWYSEVSNYDYYSNSCDEGEVCGHYTQVVWAESNSLGCGVKRCPTVKSSGYKNALIVVCNYGPGGNYEGEEPYATSGDAARAMSLKPEIVYSLDEKEAGDDLS